MVQLLAHDGTEDHQRQGKLGILLHDTSKWIIRKMVAGLHKKMGPVLEYKRKNGWRKDHIKAMEEGWNWVVSLDELPLNIGIGGFKGPDDKNRLFFKQIGEVMFTHLDEDTHYDIRWLLFMKWCHEHWDRFECSAEAAHQILDFPNIYKDLLELSKPLPQDDGHDVVQVDMAKLDKALRASKKGEDPHVEC